MTQSTLKRLEDGTIEITITIPRADVTKAYAAGLSELTKQTEINGFRKGKAPEAMVEKRLGKNKIFEEALNSLLPASYSEAVATLKLHPIVSPSVELKEAQEGKDWVVVAKTCERPTITLGDYKKVVRELKISKRTQLWVPGKDQAPDTQEDPKAKEKKPTLDELVTAFLTVVDVKIPSLLIEHEVNRQLSLLIDQTKKLGLTVEQYLASTNRTIEGIRKEYEELAQRSLTLEFALEILADRENIVVTDTDIETILKTAKTDDERKTLEKEKYYLTSVMRRQKTLDFLSNL
ncbi:hypothetical protein KKB64_02460 [Patescibacteria group bacterium]|nr:hypothetical protein [Patescibacteria group bacterium]MBU2460143.1 hypothetical protein [Patescibacteria group bacterium]MBU2544432.1 hypothetical protein [Patescibacteria group bacterium]